MKVRTVLVYTERLYDAGTHAVTNMCTDLILFVLEAFKN